MPYFGNNALTSDNNQVNTLQGIREICADHDCFSGRIATFLALALLFVSYEVAGDEGPLAAMPEIKTLSCGSEGFLSAEIFGALAGKIEWNAEKFECEGMPRPGGVGARLRFAGIVAGDYEIAFIIALPDLLRGEKGKEYTSKVTVIEEGAGRFFSSADKEICWTDIEALEEVVDVDGQFILSGSLYCVAPLVEINGASDITIGDLKFRGMLDWNAS